MGVGLFGSDLLRRKMLLELARQKVHEKNPISRGAGGVRVGSRLPRMLVGVVEDDEAYSLCKRCLESLQVAPVVFAELSDVEDIAAVHHEVVIR